MLPVSSSRVLGCLPSTGVTSSSRSAGKLQFVGDKTTGNGFCWKGPPFIGRTANLAWPLRLIYNDGERCQIGVAWHCVETGPKGRVCGTAVETAFRGWFKDIVTPLFWPWFRVVSTLSYLSLQVYVGSMLMSDVRLCALFTLQKQTSGVEWQLAIQMCSHRTVFRCHCYHELATVKLQSLNYLLSVTIRRVFMQDSITFYQLQIYWWNVVHVNWHTQTRTYAQ